VALDRRGSASPFWHANHDGSPAGQFIVRYFRQELQAEAQSPAFLTCRVVEKVHDVSSKPILEPAAFIEVERAYRIHFDLRTFAQDRTQFTLESKRPLPYLCHGERNDAKWHSSCQWGTGEDARRSIKTRSIAGLPAWRSATVYSGWAYSGLIPAAAIILPVIPFSAR
jgi:hypothetical protein